MERFLYERKNKEKVLLKILQENYEIETAQDLSFEFLSVLALFLYDNSHKKRIIM